MNSQRAMLATAVDRFFGELLATDTHVALCGSGADGPWSAVEDLGVTGVFVPEAAGGFGGSWQDAFEVFYLLGLHGVPLPVGETALAKRVLVNAGIALPMGPIALGVCENAQLRHDEPRDQWRCSGDLHSLAWGASAPSAVIACRHEAAEYVALLSTATAIVTGGRLNEAGEPRDDLHFVDAPVVALRRVKNACEDVLNGGALLRTAQISGALEAALALSVRHVNERVQFGRPIGKFQAIQHQLALLAEETAAVKCAALSACHAANGGDAGFEVAAAKLRANRAVGPATSIAHQVHGAIGFTAEHRLHRFTQRLWSWRSEFGNDRCWADHLGRLVLTQGAGNLWANLTARADREIP